MTRQVVLKRPPQGALRFGHPWIYRDQIKEVAPEAKPGDVLRVMTETDKFLARAYWNPKSEITLRVLTRKDEEVDVAFLSAKFAKALEFRRRMVKDTNSFRLISSEADGMSGLIVDKYDDVLVAQFLTLGMENLKPAILEALSAVVPNKGIYERSDASVRKLEGLAEVAGWIGKPGPEEVIVRERDVEIVLRFGAGHKTGWYLDQRDNRFILRDLAVSGAQALDAFCYEGGFGLQLAKAGMSVLGIDSQKDVIERAERHRKHNGLSESQLSFQVGNAFDVLKEIEKSGKKFDVIVMDPPSFVKQKSALKGALAGYKEILIRGFKMLNTGGKIAIFSCAYHLDDNFLMEASLAAARDARVNLRLLKFLKQAADHPIDPFIAESYYLKGFLFEVTN